MFIFHCKTHNYFYFYQILSKIHLIFDKFLYLNIYLYIFSLSRNIYFLSQYQYRQNDSLDIYSNSTNKSLTSIQKKNRLSNMLSQFILLNSILKNIDLYIIKIL